MGDVTLVLQYSDRLRESLSDVYARWQETQRDHLLALDEQYEAKFDLSLAVDRAYEDGSVFGKNEREREAHLRQLLPDHHSRMVDADRKVRTTERALRSSQIEAERLRLEILLGDITTRG